MSKKEAPYKSSYEGSPHDLNRMPQLDIDHLKQKFGDDIEIVRGYMSKGLRYNFGRHLCVELN